MTTNFALFSVGLYFILLVVNGYFIYRVCESFVTVKDTRWSKALLFSTLMLTSGMVIWIGDNNFAMTLPFYITAFLVATEGDLLGRFTVGGIFFCFIMSVGAMADTYMIPLDRQGYYDIASRLFRPLIFGLFYLFFHRHLKQEPIKLPRRLWKLCAGITILPFTTLSTLILPAYWMPDSILLHNLNWFQGAIILPISLLASLVILRSIMVLDDYETKAQAATLAEMREVYYQGLKREQTQVRTLRHDLRNHLNVAVGFLEQGEAEKARQYLLELTDSQALRTFRRMSENEIVNVVLSSKCEAMKQCGILADIRIFLPPILPIVDTDLCALLGNALDNAIEAAQKSENKKVIVRCKIDRGVFMLRIQNSLAGDERTDFSTTKQDKKLHGFGLRGMREIATKYGGVLEAEAKDGVFELIVSIPILTENKTN